MDRPRSDTLGWMSLHADVLFVCDARGRILRTADPVAPQPAPRLFLGRTVNGAAWRMRADVADDTATELSSLCASEPPLDDPAQVPRYLAAYRRLLDAPSCGVTEQVFRFPRTLPSCELEGQLVHVTADEGALLGPSFPDWEEDAGRRDPFVALLRGGRVVALCASARMGARVHEAGVETLAGQRGRGFGSAVVAAWARSVRARGAEPLYSTSWDNAASLAIARKLGLIRYGVDLHLA